MPHCVISYKDHTQNFALSLRAATKHNAEASSLRIYVYEPKNLNSVQKEAAQMSEQYLCRDKAALLSHKCACRNGESIQHVTADS